MKKGFTLIELLVVIAIIAILAAILFPVFAKAREKARQTTCTSNQKQIATAVMMYVQENNEIMPGTDFWSVIGVTGKVLQCPTAGKKLANAYGYNGNLENLGLGEIDLPTETILSADATENYLDNPTQFDFRHTGKMLTSYVDSHVELTKSINGFIVLHTNIFADKTLADFQLVGGNNGRTYDSSAQVLVYNDYNPNGHYLVFELPDASSATSWWGFSCDYETGTNVGNINDANGNNSFGMTNSLEIVSGTINTGDVTPAYDVLIGQYATHMWRDANTWSVAGVFAGSEKDIFFKPQQHTGYNGSPLIQDTVAYKLYKLISPKQRLTIAAFKDGTAMVSWGSYSAIGKISDPAKWNQNLLVYLGANSQLPNTCDSYGTCRITNAKFDFK